MKPWIPLEKAVGETPLMCLERWRAQHPEYEDVPASYAGRLDPMASGKLLILLGEECKKQNAYIGLDKEYEIEVVLDLATDTGDVLGLPRYANKDTRESVKKVLRRLTGTHSLPYPAFSSKTVKGKPLFLHTLEGNDVRVPTHEETIYRIQLIRQDSISKADLSKRIVQTLMVVPKSDEPSKVLGADFRQDEIRARWNEIFSTMPDRTFSLIHLRVTCASGTYMRTLAERIGEALETRGLALSIHRTKVGRYHQTLRFWTKQYN